MGQGATFAMIFGAPSKFAALNQFVSAEYHLLQMIFSSECFLQSNYFNKIHRFLPPGTALVMTMARLMPLFLALCGNASASPAQGWPQRVSWWGREKLSRPGLPGGVWDPISAVPLLDRALTPSHTTQPFSWSWMMDPGFLLSLVPTSFLDLSLYVCLIFTYP